MNKFSNIFFIYFKLIFWTILYSILLFFVLSKIIFLSFFFFYSISLGSSGSKITLKANYFKLLKATDWAIHQYRVDFAPEEDRTVVRKGLLKLHQKTIGPYIFDGTVMYTSRRLPDVSVYVYVCLVCNFWVSFKLIFFFFLTFFQANN